MSDEQQYFFGESESSVDSANRLTIPDFLRKSLGSRCIVTRGPDRALFIFSLNTWAEIESKIKNAIFNREIGLMQRLMGGRAEVQVDSQGRITLPRHLQGYANLGPSTAASVIGQGSKVEVWNRDIWNEYSRENFGYEEIYPAAKLAGLEDVVEPVAA